MIRLLRATKKVAGYKQTMNTIEKGSAELVYLAKDAEEKIRTPILEACRVKGIPVVDSDSMNDLGKAVGIQIGTAVAAIIKQI